MSHVSSLYPRVLEMNEHGAFIFLLNNEDTNIISWTGKFIHNAFVKRGLLQANTTGSIVAIPPAVVWSHETQSTFLLREVWQVHKGKCGYLHINIFASILHANICASTLHVNMFASVLRVYVFSCVYVHLRMFMYV